MSAHSDYVPPNPPGFVWLWNRSMGGDPYETFRTHLPHVPYEAMKVEPWKDGLALFVAVEFAPDVARAQRVVWSYVEALDVQCQFLQRWLR